jgi:hypothetical protein
METLAVMERIPVDDEDRPKKEIKILSMKIFVNPYTEPDEEEVSRRLATIRELAVSNISGLPLCC